MSIDGPTLPTASAPCSAQSSPRNRRKFLCSHGGKILPRPSDGHLKYVGGETRVFNVSREISFQEVMKKLTSHIDEEMLLKYEVASEDLDTLVSVRSDEDLRNMFEEIDRYENAGTPRLRAFLFPVNPLVMENQMGPFDPHALEQRYIDAINGIIRVPPYSIKRHPALNAMHQQGSLVSSACSSPRSADSSSNEAILNNESGLTPTRTNMFKVQSSPNICSLTIPQQNRHMAHQHVLPPSHSPGWQSPKQQLVTTERLISARSMGFADGVRQQMDLSSPNNYYTSKQSRGNGCCSKCTHYDDWGQFPDRRAMERMGSHVLSPVSSVTRLSNSGTKGWDGTVGGEM